MKRLQWTTMLTVLAAMLLAGTQVLAETYTWNVDDAGNWTNASNWDPDTGFPDGAGHTAVLDPDAVNLTAHRIVTIDGDRTVGRLNMLGQHGGGAANRNFTLSGGKLILDSGSSDPAVIMYGTNCHSGHVSSTLIELASDLHLAMESQYGNGNMTFSGGIHSPDGKARTLSYRQWREGGQSGGYFTISGAITGGSATHPLSIVSDGNPGSSRPLYLTGANTFTGSITVVSGGLQVNSSFGAADNPVVFSNGTWMTAGSFTAPNPITLAGNATFTVNAGTFDIAGPLTVSAGGTLNKTGVGKLRISGDNAASFSTAANVTYAGILELGHGKALGAARAFTLSNYALLTQTVAADSDYTYDVQAYGGIGGNAAFFDSLTFGIAGGGNMDIAANGIVFGDSLAAMNQALKDAGRGREFFQLVDANNTYTIRDDRVWKGLTNLGYGAYTSLGTVYVLTIDTDCDFVLRSRGVSGQSSFGLNQLVIEANGVPVVVTFDGPIQLNGSTAAGYTNVTFRILDFVRVWEGTALGQGDNYAGIVIENGGNLQGSRHAGHGLSAPMQVGNDLLVRAGGQVTWDGDNSRRTPVHILSGTTLSGEGTLAAYWNRIEGGATLAPGEDGVGTLTFTRTLEMEGGAIYEWELGAAANDRVDASVTEVAFDGAWTLKIRDAGGSPDPATPYVLFTYDTLTGFDPGAVQLDYGDLNWFGAQVENDADNKQLVLTGLAAPAPGTLILMR